MSNNEIIELAKKDGDSLSMEAFSILKQEFIRRKLDMSTFSRVEQNRLITNKYKIKQEEETNKEEFTKSIWILVFDEKKSGKSNEDIIAGLIDRGFSEHQASNIMDNMETAAKSLSDISENQMLKNGIFFIIGLIVTIITYTNALSGGTYIIAYGAIIFGGYRFIEGVINKKKYQSVLKLFTTKKS
ncbi:MAG: hypothetical protein ABI921_08720 [Panacibacter sp.]